MNDLTVLIYGAVVTLAFSYLFFTYYSQLRQIIMTKASKILRNHRIKQNEGLASRRQRAMNLIEIGIQEGEFGIMFRQINKHHSIFTPYNWAVIFMNLPLSSEIIKEYIVLLEEAYPHIKKAFEEHRGTLGEQFIRRMDLTSRVAVFLQGIQLISRSTESDLMN